jgi:hypothetical protein
MGQFSAAIMNMLNADPLLQANTAPRVEAIVGAASNRKPPAKVSACQGNR